MAVKEYTRSGGAKSGTESFFIGIFLVLVLWPLVSLKVMLYTFVILLGIQFCLASQIDRNLQWHMMLSQKLGPSAMRNGMIGFAECVRPGGKPNSEHCLSLYNLPPMATSMIFGVYCLLFAFNPTIALVRLFYPEHRSGVPKNPLELYWFFLRHPSAVQGEGPSNGDGLAAMNASESIVYPITPKDLVQGPTDRDYWLGEEKRPRFRDMFHDKVFAHRFFESHGAPHPILVAEVANHKRRQIWVEPKDAPAKVLWKPRYSTMGLGVEHFDGWEKVDDGKEWAPSSVPYIIEEFIQSTDHESAEWMRMTTLWDFEEDAPKPGYIWEHRNHITDDRVQTDIIGGRNLVTSQYTPFVGQKEKGMAHDTRAGTKVPLCPRKDKALCKAIGLQLKMHKNLGKELHSIGWDVMVRGEEPIFIEFNINNGFFVCDHSMPELWTMAEFYRRNFMARLPGQLLNFDPYAEEEDPKSR